MRNRDRVVRRRLADGTIRIYRYARKKREVDPNSLAALIRAYTASPEWLGLAAHTRTTYLIYLRPFDEIDQVSVADMDRRKILAIRDAIATTRGNGAATGFVRAASALFGWAVDHDWITHSPVHRIKKLPGGHLRAWTQEEARAALDGLPEHLRRVVVLGMYTGQRRGDLCAMTWSAYDGETVRVKQGKTGAELAIAAHPTLRTELNAWRAGTGSVTILTNTKGRPWTEQHLSRELPRALVAIGLPRDLVVHGLRKLAAANLADAGCTPHEIAAITGHRTLQMVEFYTRSADQKRLAKAAVLKLVAGRDKA